MSRPLYNMASHLLKDNSVWESIVLVYVCVYRGWVGISIVRVDNRAIWYIGCLDMCRPIFRQFSGNGPIIVLHPPLDVVVMNTLILYYYIHGLNRNIFAFYTQILTSL